MRVREKIEHSVKELNERLIERDQLIKLTILAMFSKAHMFLIGERGVAKSLTVRLLGKLIGDAKYWELQVGVDTEAKQLFGEKRIADNGTIYYNAVNTVLDAHIIFLDEMFKAKSSILNMLLQMMADRYYTTGDGRMIEVPLIFLIGASNEYPTGSLAEPYLDRLDFWYDVSRIQTRENRLKFFNTDFNQKPIEEPIFTLDEINETYREAIKSVSFPDNVLETLNDIIDNFILQGVKTSDRKYSNAIKSMKVSAYINGRESINFSELFLFLFTSWHNDIERRKVVDVIYYRMFSNKAHLEGLVKDVKDGFEKNDTYYKSDLYNYSNHLLSFTGERAVEAFQSYLSATHECLITYNKLYEELEKTKNEIERILNVEQLVKENIFLSEIENKSITDDLLESIRNIETLIVNEWKIINSWIENNNTLHSYNEKKHILNDKTNL